jgi:hypothetical protein
MMKNPKHYIAHSLVFLCLQSLSHWSIVSTQDQTLHQKIIGAWSCQTPSSNTGSTQVLTESSKNFSKNKIQGNSFVTIIDNDFFGKKGSAKMKIDSVSSYKIEANQLFITDETASFEFIEASSPEIEEFTKTQFLPRVNIDFQKERKGQVNTFNIIQLDEHSLVLQEYDDTQTACTR